VAVDPIVELGLVRNRSPMVHAILALILLVVATVLAIYKPFGMTPYGSRKLAERRPEIATAIPAGSAASVRPANKFPWSYVVASIAVVVLLLLVMHFAGIGMRH
jgi:hypothetical protein